MTSRLAGRLLALAGVIALAGAACSADDGARDAALRSFTDVQSSDISFEIDPNDPARAIFHVTTSVPMICSITWGETESLGHQNNSLSMNGTGIEQHDVVLPGAEPGTEYFFTVQGSDANGVLYTSDLMTVTIPETGSAVFAIGSSTFDTSPDGGPSPGAASTTTVDPRAMGENLALGATITAISSEFSASFAGELAIDDDFATEWSSRDDGDEAYLELDLGSPQAIAGVEFITRSMADQTAITTTFTVTVDGEKYGPFDAGTPRNPRFAALEGAMGQLVRFDVSTSSGGNTGAVELRVLAPA